MRYIEILNESQRYDDMFNAILNLDGVNAKIQSDISFAKSVLQRKDRITWFLKWSRLIFLYKYMYGESGEMSSIDEPKKKYEPVLTKYAKSVGIGINDIKNYRTNFKTSLEHYLSIESNEIQSLVWDKQTPTELVNELHEKEIEWSAKQDQYITYFDAEDEPDIFLKIDNDWAWYDLNAKSCDKESKAMGHCGNSASYDYNDNIISLRKRKEYYNGKVTHRPSLTFILNDGYLGEMKGRANEKPKEKYHNAIVRLLKDPRIKGITGGGYEPKKNFSIDDLSDEHLTKLADKEHALRGPYYTYERYYDLKRANASEDELDQVEALYLSQMNKWLKTLDNRDIAKIDLQKDTIIFHEYEDYDTYSGYYHNGLTDKIFKKLSSLKRDMAIHLDIPFSDASKIISVASKGLKKEILNSAIPYEYSFYSDNTEVYQKEDGSISISQDLSDFMEDYFGDNAHEYDAESGFLRFADDEYPEDDISNDPIVNRLVDLVGSDARNSTEYYSDITKNIIKDIYDRFHDIAKYGDTQQDYRQRELNI